MSKDKKEIGHYVDGNHIVGKGNAYGDVYNPALGKAVARVSLAGSKEVEDAIQSANQAFASWSETPPPKRAAVMFAFRHLLKTHIDELALLVSSEHGKTLEDAKGSITRGIEVVEFSCSIAQNLRGEFHENVGSGIDSWNTRQPLGVCVGITPFNFPAMVPLWMFPVAIACGNTFILKPSEQNPSCALRMAELMTEAGLPKGVLNVVNGDKKAVDVLLNSPLTKAISFVGSSVVGEYIYHTATKNNKRVQALCGAKNHLVLMPDADMEKAADAVLGAAYGSAGERCMAISVVVAVGDETADSLLEVLLPKIDELKMGSYANADVDMGPVINPKAKERILAYIKSGKEEGAKAIRDGSNQVVKGFEEGCFVGPTLLDHVTEEMRVYKEEIFGPVLSIVRVSNYEEALSLVNRHPYGNGAAIFTRDGDSARNFGNRVQAGMVGINVPIPVPMAFHSFGGWKRSIFGDHAIHGMEGVRFYTKLKTLTSRWPSGIRSGAVFNFNAGGEH